MARTQEQRYATQARNALECAAQAYTHDTKVADVLDRWDIDEQPHPVSGDTLGAIGRYDSRRHGRGVQKLKTQAIQAFDDDSFRHIRRITAIAHEHNTRA